MNFAGKWLDLESTMLNNVSQSQKEKPAYSLSYADPSL